MRYTLDNKPFPDSACHVLDANGLEYFQVLEFDTETGEIVRQVTDAENYLLADPVTGLICTETIKVPSPLIVKRCGTHGICDSRHRIAGWRYVGCTCDKIANMRCPLWDTAHRRDEEEFREALRQFRAKQALTATEKGHSDRADSGA